MAKTKDLSPKMSIPSAEVELQLPFMNETMGRQMGGVSMFSNSMKRGFGNQTFGVDENGMWLGAPEFDTAPLKFSLDGSMTITNAQRSGRIDAYSIIYYEQVEDESVPVIVIGDPQ